ncbi:isochorismatase family protein [Halobacillus litoralis]|uniref:isochorismatase family protein n=1 Tax=Halobacillus litoralis TaxID=45668 RepID=UPI001CFC5D66|nr:isochorismatase family protein [Halobacillus litoralis]
MQALLVIDVQRGLVDQGDFKKELTVIERIIHDFQIDERPVFFIKHLDHEKESPLFKGSTGSELHPYLSKYADRIIQKNTPSSFYQTELAEELQEQQIDHVFITGFNTEFCCLFTSIAAFDRGYKVTYLEDAATTVNTSDQYDMPGLHIKTFIETVLHWSGSLEVLNDEEYREIYGKEDVL